MLERLRRQMPSAETIASNRWLRWLGPSVLHPRLFHLSRRGVAKGAAIGVFFAFITPIAQIPLSAAACVVLRAHVPVAIVATLVNTPPTFGPVYYAAWKLGSWVLAEPVDDAHAPAVLSGVAPAASAPVALGTPLINPPAGVTASAAPPASPGADQGWWQQTLEKIRNIGKPLLVGTLMFAVGFSALAWVLCNSIWHWRVRRKRRRRLAGLG